MAIENGTADAFVALIRKIVREEIVNAQRNSGIDVETFRHCKVVDVNNKTANDNGKTVIVETTSADIQDLGTGERHNAVPNKSGEILEAGDTVRVYETQGSYNKRYIGLKCS